MRVHATRTARTTTCLPPCAIQVWPQDKSVVLVGTYKLEESGTRHGSLDVYRDGENLTLMGSVATKSSILDVKICPHDSSIVMTGQSAGSIIVWRMQDGPEISQIGEYTLFDPNTLILSIAFSEDDSSIMAATLSSGEVAVIRITSFELTLLGISGSHSLEAWTCSFGTKSLQNVLFSGGDDAVLAAHDLRLMSDSCDGPVWSCNRLHDAGITSILPSSRLFKPADPLCLWTGGYDDNLRCVDLRVGPQSTVESYLLPIVNDSVYLEGGVWRLVPGANRRILACCMYRGAYILELQDDLAKPIVEMTEGHGSMVYGGDWLSDQSVVTCSFYDKQLQTWSVV